MCLYEAYDQSGLVESIVNEFNCCYRNKIVSQEKKGKFDQLIAGIVKTHFKMNIRSDNIFSCISGKYVKIKKDDYLNILKSTMIQYEREYQEITFVMLEESVNYICSIEKMLTSNNNNNILMVGVSGVGRQISFLLASIILKMEIYRLPTLRDFSVREFKKELKSIIEIVIN